jgi:hypothetical protein
MVAARMPSGTALSTGAFGFASLTVKSALGKPPAARRMRIGSFTPPKSR